MLKRTLKLLVIVAATNVVARGWTPGDLVQRAEIECQLIHNRAGFQEVLAREKVSGQTPSLRGGINLRAEFEGRVLVGTLRAHNDSAYIALNDGQETSEWIRPQFLANDNIWVSKEVSEDESLRWLCSYRTATGQDLTKLKDLHTALELLHREIQGAYLESSEFTDSNLRACHKIGVALMRAQKLAEESNTTAVGWRAQSTITELRDRIATEGILFCDGRAAGADMSEAFNRIFLKIAAVRSALSPGSR